MRAVSFPSYRHEVFASIPATEPDQLPSSSSQAAIPPADGIFDTSFDPESYQYDFDFAQELWERAGLTGGDDSLPLYVTGTEWHLDSRLTATSCAQVFGWRIAGRYFQRIVRFGRLFRSAGTRYEV